MLKKKYVQSVFNSLPIPFLILRADIPDFTIEGVNEAYLEASGMDEDNMLNNSFLELLTTKEDPKDGERILNLKASLVQVLSTKEKHMIKAQKLSRPFNKSKVTEDKFWHVKNTPLINDDGEIEFIVHMLIEPTDQGYSNDRSENENKLLKSEVAKQTIHHENIRQELDNFVYSVSHDLRAPLRRLDGFSQELINEYSDQLDETGAHYLNRIRQGAQDLGNLIDDLLKLSRISRSTIDREELNIGEMVKEVFEELTKDKKIKSTSLNLNGELTTEADRGLTYVLINNLLSNAIKFTRHQDNPSITVGLTKGEASSTFYIKDNGAGFDSAHSEKLFKAFNRLHTQKEFEGTGLGLAIVNRIVNLHGGEIWAESSPDNGATFYFSLQYE